MEAAATGSSDRLLHTSTSTIPGNDMSGGASQEEAMMAIMGIPVRYLMWTFLSITPITSWGDSVLVIYRRKSSSGFSMDLCAIMLISSILRVFFWIGRPFDNGLVFQAISMICVQLILLDLAVRYRRSGYGHLAKDVTPSRRPFQFWEWDHIRSFRKFLIGFVLTLALLQYTFGHLASYVDLVGFLALGIEAILPLPQLLTNARRKSIKGFRLSLLASWLLGDVIKLSYFSTGENIAPQFMICGLVQMSLDLAILTQYIILFYSQNKTIESEIPLHSY